MSGILGFLILVAVVVFLFFQVKGIICDIKAKKAKKLEKERVKNNQAETEKEKDTQND